MGGLLATLPDLDVIVRYSDPVASFTYHRSATHSLLLLSVVTPLLAWCAMRLAGRAALSRVALSQGGERVSFRAWCWMVWLCLITHPLLDAATVYGTQLLWPLSEHPFGAGSIFIIDPLYTLPLAAGVIAFVAMRRRRRLGVRLAVTGLSVSTAYLALTLLFQAHVTAIIEEDLRESAMAQARLLVIPTPFNALLWRAVVMQEDAYYVGYYSLLAPRRPIEFKSYAHDEQLLEAHADVWAVRRLKWFSRGFLSAEVRAGQLVLSDLRMGAEPDFYVFSFAVAAHDGARLVPYSVTRRIPPIRPDKAALARIYERLMTGS